VALSGGIAAVLLLVITVASFMVAQKDREAKHEQDKAMQAVIDQQKAEHEQQKAEREKQAALQATAEKADRRLKAFQPYVQAMDLLMRDQMPEKAASLLADALNIDPDFPEAQFALAEAYRAAGIPKKAAESYLKADELSMKIGGRHNLHAIVAAGFTYDGAGQYDAAQDCFERAEKFGADDPLAHVGRCFRLVYERQLREGKDVADAAIKRGGHLWEAHFAFGYVVLEMAKDGLIPAEKGRTDALAAFRKALELSPRQAETCEWLALSLLVGRPTPANIEEAKSYINRAIELEPLNGNRYVSRATFRHGSGDPLGADADLADARRLGAWEPLLRKYEAERAEERGDLEGAFTEISYIVKNSREWPPFVYGWLCMAYELKKEEFTPAFQQWAKKNPNYPYVFGMKASISTREGDYKNAIVEAKKGLEIAPYSTQLNRLLIAALLADRQYKEAYQAAEKADKLVPNDAGIKVQKARVLISTLNLDPAEKVVDEIEKLEPRLKKDIEQMREIIKKFREKKPPAPPAPSNQ